MKTPVLADGTAGGLENRVGSDRDPLRRGAWSAFRRDRWAVAAAAFIVLVAAWAAAGLFVWPDASTAQDLAARNLGPGSSLDGQWFPLGTDNLGRDMVGMLSAGARYSLMIGVVVAAIAAIVGGVLGVVAGYYGGRVDDIISRWIDVQMGFPTVLLALSVLYALGAGVTNLVIVLAATRWMVFARVARSVVLKTREEQFVEAARSVGCRESRILRRHILPSVLPALAVLLTLDAAWIMLIESSLSFLGMGIQPPNTSWGSMLAQGREYMRTAWWLCVFPGVAIFFSCLSLNLLAARFRVVLDPTLR